MAEGKHKGDLNKHNLYEDVPILENTLQTPVSQGASQDGAPNASGIPQRQEAQVAEMLPLLEAWFAENARELEWRSHPTDYYVWVSEIMLQQTRVEAVKPYFARFMEAFPEISDLAAAPPERLLKYWEGLGYYSRARNLQKTAQLVMQDYDGHLPADYRQLLRLPGIGPYTAGAIASIAYNLPEPAVDGNVLRVLARYTGCADDITRAETRKRFEAWLREAYRMKPECSARIVNQALMELGALVCIPNGEPQCLLCPLSERCLAYRRGLTGQLPVKAPKKPRRREEMTVFLIYQGERVLVRKRAEKGLLSGLYEFPNTAGSLTLGEASEWLREALRQPPAAHEDGSANKCAACGYPEAENFQIAQRGRAKHIFTHIEWDMTVYEVMLAGGVRGQLLEGSFADAEALRREITLPTAFLQLLRQ